LRQLGRFGMRRQFDTRTTLFLDGLSNGWSLQYEPDYLLLRESTVNWPVRL
jgi:hypothetical protein